MLNESVPVMSAVKTYYFACTIFSFSIRIRNYQTIKFTDHCLIILNFSEILLSLLTSEMIPVKVNTEYLSFRLRFAEMSLGPCRISMMKVFCKNSSFWSLTKTPSKMFDRVLNTLMICSLLSLKRFRNTKLAPKKFRLMKTKNPSLQYAFCR